MPAAGLVLVLLLAACGSAESGDPDDAIVAAAPEATIEPTSAPIATEPVPTEPPTSTVGASADSAGDDAGEQAPASFPPITLTNSSGGQIDFGSLQGQDTVLWFWAPW